VIGFVSPVMHVVDARAIQMRWGRASAAVAALLCGATVACSGAGERLRSGDATSFDALGVPNARPSPGRATVVVGWDHEARGGWSVSAIRIEGRDRAEWDPTTQRPAVMVLEPGLRSLQVVAEQRATGQGGSVRRLRLAPVRIQLGEGDAATCRVRVEARDDGRLRPLVRCEISVTTVAPARTTRELMASPYEIWSPEPEPRAPAPAPAPPASPTPIVAEASTQGSDLLGSPYRGSRDALTDRVRRLEDRLDRIERMLRDQARAQRAGCADCQEQ
jgi:hypothetical protein